MNTENHPLVSVIMCVRNGLPYLDDAVRSVLDQTYTSLEFIIIDDFSSDATYEHLAQWAQEDGRIRLFKAERNLGIGGARDFCIQHARSKFIAFMDADDISYPQRIEKQLNFLQKHPEIIAVGVQTDLINEQGKTFGKKTFPTDPATLRKMLYLYAPLQIPSTMVCRTALPLDFKWFEGVHCGEDTILFFKLLQYGEFANLNETLYGYRQHATTTTSTKTKAVFKETWKARRIGRNQYGYKASLKMRMISGLQFIAVTCMPSVFINRFYQKLRVMLQKIGMS